MSDELQNILKEVAEGKQSVSNAYEALKGYEDLGFVKVDHHRAKRKGFPEVIYGQGKTTEQVLEIFQRLMENNDTVLATRISDETAKIVTDRIPDIKHDPISKTLIFRPVPKELVNQPIGILCAGTTDIPVAEEAAITAIAMGNPVKRFYDIGVAGIHRLFDNLSEIQTCSVLIVIAGMEGALASVVGGLVQQPVIAVPTSVGYGANLQGLSPLLTMLNSCASGVTVVNIDNGFGAAYSASLINRLGIKEE